MSEIINLIKKYSLKSKVDEILIYFENLDGRKINIEELLEEGCEIEKLKLKILHSKKKLSIGYGTTMNRVNKYYNVIQDLKMFLKEMKIQTYDNLYVEFGKDKNGDPICLVCNLSKIDFNKAYNSLVVHVFFGEYSNKKFKSLYMYLIYDLCNESIEIGDIRTGKPWCGHATFALDVMGNRIIKEINKMIERYNVTQNDEYKVEKIIRITGKIGPSTKLMTSTELINFYTKRGYYKNGIFGRRVD